MLIKKKILQAELPELDDEGCVARIFQLPSSGRVFIMDIISKPLSFPTPVKYRCACDGKNQIIYDYNKEIWTEGKLYYLVGWRLDISSIDYGTDYAARRFFKKQTGSAFRIFEQWQSDYIDQKRYTQKERRLSLQEKRLKMFPEIGKKVVRWCDKKVFSSYLFMSNSEKGKRVIKCSSCGAEMVMGAKEHKHKERGKCPKCKREGIYFLERYKGSILDKEKINLYYKKDGYILSRWSKVVRTFNLKGEAEFAFSDYWYTGISIDGGKEFYYGEIISPYSANYIGRKYWREPSRNENCKVFKSGLNKVLSEYIHGFDIESVADKINGFMETMINLHKFPQTEYLLKLGLYNLAVYAKSLHPEGSGFSNVLGLSKQYLPLYQKLNPSLYEHYNIKNIAKEEFVNEELACIIIKRGINIQTIKNIREFSGGGSAGKIIRYIDKQDFSGNEFLNEYRDYFSMAKELGITLEKKYDIWPKNLREEHDRLSEKVNILRDEKKEQAFLNAISELYKTIPENYENEKLMIRLPMHARDFSTEGQNLKICVGSYGYCDRHMSGDNLICFIRKTESPDESYVCCEISLKTYKVKQVHGYKNDLDKPLSKEVKRFAENYAKHIEKFRKKVA